MVCAMVLPLLVLELFGVPLAVELEVRDSRYDERWRSSDAVIS